MRLLLLAVLLSFGAAAAKPLKSFDKLFTALTTGQDVRAVIHYGETTLVVDGKEEEAPDAIGGMDLWPYEYFPKGMVRNDHAYVSCSESSLIYHPSYGHVYNYVKLRVYADQSVQIMAQYLDPKSFEVKMDETFKGKIGEGIYLYSGD